MNGCGASWWRVEVRLGLRSDLFVRFDESWVLSCWGWVLYPNCAMYVVIANALPVVVGTCSWSHRLFGLLCSPRLFLKKKTWKNLIVSFEKLINGAMVVPVHGQGVVQSGYSLLTLVYCSPVAAQ